MSSYKITIYREDRPSLPLFDDYMICGFVQVLSLYSFAIQINSEFNCFLFIQCYKLGYMGQSWCRVSFGEVRIWVLNAIIVWNTALHNVLDIKSKSSISTCYSYHVFESSRLINPYFGQPKLYPSESCCLLVRRQSLCIAQWTDCSFHAWKSFYQESYLWWWSVYQCLRQMLLDNLWVKSVYSRRPTNTMEKTHWCFQGKGWLSLTSYLSKYKFGNANKLLLTNNNP